MTGPDGITPGPNPWLDPALLARARRAAWQAASWTWPAPGDTTAITRTAGPLAAWMGQAWSDEDLLDRIRAARSWTRAAERPAGQSLLPEGDGEHLAADVRGIYEWVTEPCQAHPGSPAAALPGRALFIYRCLLEHATAETPGRPAMDPAELVSGAWRRARSGQLLIGLREVDGALAAMYRGDPREGAPGSPSGSPRARLGAPRSAVVRGGLGSAGAGEAATTAGPGAAAGGQPEAGTGGPFGPPGDGPAAAGPAW